MRQTSTYNATTSEITDAMKVPGSCAIAPHVVQIAWQRTWKTQAVVDTPVTRGAFIRATPCRIIAKACGMTSTRPKAADPTKASRISKTAPSARPGHNRRIER